MKCTKCQAAEALSPFNVCGRCALEAAPSPKPETHQITIPIGHDPTRMALIRRVATTFALAADDADLNIHEILFICRHILDNAADFGIVEVNISGPFSKDDTFPTPQGHA